MSLHPVPAAAPRDGVTLVAFDFDGTLSAIRNDPADAVIEDAAAEFLAEAARTPGVVVAIASGRDTEDLARRLRGLPVYLIASHGLEIRAPYGDTIRETIPLRVELDARVRRCAEVCNFRIERKRYGLALHWRGVRYLHAQHPVVERFRDWAKANHLQVIDGRCVVEARVPGAGKETALRWVSSATSASRVIFAGDDVTDYAALRFASQHGRAFFVRNEERAAPFGVTVVDSCEALIRVVREELPV